MGIGLHLRRRTATTVGLGLCLGLLAGGVLTADERQYWYNEARHRPWVVAKDELWRALADFHADPTPGNARRAERAGARFEELSAEFLPHVQRHHPSWVACVLWDRANALVGSGLCYVPGAEALIREDPEHARQLCEQAVQYLEEACDPTKGRRLPHRLDDLAAAYLALARAEAALAGPGKRYGALAEKHFRRAVELHRGTGHLTAAARAEMKHAEALLQAGDRPAGERAYEDALALCAPDWVRFEEKPELLRQVAAVCEGRGEAQRAAELRAKAESLRIIEPGKIAPDDWEGRYQAAEVSRSQESTYDVVRLVQRRAEAARRTGNRQARARYLQLLGKFHSIYFFPGFPRDEAGAAGRHAAAWLKEGADLHAALWAETQDVEFRRQYGYDLAYHAVIAYQQEDWEASIGLGQRAAAVGREVGDSELCARALRNVGKVQEMSGYLPAANATYEQALQAWQPISEASPTNQLALADTLSQLACVESARGLWDQALQHLAEAEQVSERLLAGPLTLKDMGRAQVTLNFVLVQLAGYAEYQGNLTASLDYLDQAIPVEPGPGPSTEARARRAFLCALLMRSQGPANELRQQARRGRDAMVAIINDGSVHPFDRLRAGSALAEWALELDSQPDKALGYCDQARRGLRDWAAGRFAPAMEAEIDLSRGEALLRLKRLDEARQVLEGVLAIAEEQQLMPLAISAQTLLGDLSRAAGDNAAAARAYSTAAQRSEELFHSMTGSMETQIGMTQILARPYLRLAELALDRGDEEAAFEYAERGKARILRELLERSGLVAGALLSPEDQEKQRQLGQKLWDAAQIHASLTREGSSPEELAAVANRLEAARKAYREFDQALCVRYPGLRERRGAGISAQEAEALVQGHDAVLLEYVVFDEKVGVFALDESRIRYAELPMTRSELEPLTHRCLAKLSPSKEGRLGAREPIWDDLRHLYVALLAPVRDMLEDCGELVIVPDDFLAEVPFGALLAGTGESGYILERWRIVMMPTAALLQGQWSDEQQLIQHDRLRLLAVAYSNPGQETRRGAYSLLRGTPGELRYARQEARRVREVLRLPGDLLEEEQATEDAFQQAVGRADYVHCAAHFYADPVSPLDSYLRLAPEGDSASRGELEAREMAQMPLRAELVTLSCCSTAGQPAAREGLMGASWALMAAGARSTLVTLWPIQDEHTPKFMAAMYRALRRTQSKQEALREAQLAMLADPETDHPSVWAPYCLIARGPFEPLSLPSKGSSWLYIIAVLFIIAGVGSGLLIRAQRHRR